MSDLKLIWAVVFTFDYHFGFDFSLCFCHIEILLFFSSSAITVDAVGPYLFSTSSTEDYPLPSAPTMPKSFILADEHTQLAGRAN